MRNYRASPDGRHTRPVVSSREEKEKEMAYEISWDNDWREVEHTARGTIYHDGVTYAVCRPWEEPGDASAGYAGTISLARLFLARLDITGGKPW